ncbi:unnamed protein product [Leptidea sinapis]|uniref:PH domain-containing protein n=1 Tax=Leptidea sinapis TaxID=189913 RepID=A0A5E4QLJ1_9NEOP|nr:unnamed protein product [Leptidea sinapis]
MSGYLEVKYPLKSNLVLNPFKSWKKQWCILRPSATCGGGGSLAVYCSEAGAAAGTIDLPAGCLVKRAKSRSRPHAFAVFSLDSPSKPRILLAAQSVNEAHLWMDKIKDLLNGDKMRGSDTLLKDSYPVTVLATELSRKCGLISDSVLTLSASGLLVSQPSSSTNIDWKHITEVLLKKDGDMNKTCSLSIDSGFSQGSGEMKFSTPLANELVVALRQTLMGTRVKRMSRSEGDLTSNNEDICEVRRSSWYSGPSEVSLDDTDLLISKECQESVGTDYGKRLKSDSRISSPKCETKEMKDVETKKKRFDFTPTRDIFKSFKVSKKMKGLKIGLTKNETKSCEFLDDTRHVTANRCSKSVECIDNEFDLSTDISIQINETNMSALALPEEIVELILNNEQFTKVRLKETSPPLTIESDYMPMSPIASVPPIVPPIEQHYTVMSPRGHTA